MFKELSIIEFNNKFKSDEDCLEFIATTKWSNGFCCIKCKHTLYGKGRTKFYRRCKKCGYDESPTANTIFHKCKMGLLKAFYSISEIATNKKGIASTTLSEKVNVNIKTAQLFRRKMQFCMETESDFIINTNVEVDEFSIGGHSTGNPGRSLNGKKHAIIALEFNHKQENMKAVSLPLKGFDSKSISEIFTKYIHPDTFVLTDGFRGYAPLQSVYLNMDSKLSDNGKNFEKLHIVIFNLKNWLRGIHHHCSVDYLQNYLNEFMFRFNNRGENLRKNIFKTLFIKAINHLPLTSTMIKQICVLNG